MSVLPRRLAAAIMALAVLSVGSSQQVGAPAPDFSLVDGDGALVRLSELRGTPVVMNVWATWCGPCRREMPILQRAGDELGGLVQFLLVNEGERRAAVQDYLRDAEITLPVALDPTRAQASRLAEAGHEVDGSDAVIRRYRVFGLPSTFLIDGEGTLRATHVGPVDASSLASLLAEVGVVWGP